MARSAAWTRKEGQDPTGGLNARGRAAYKAATGGTLRPPVKSGDDPRRASFLARMSGNAGPMVKDGKPTRLALALRKWGASSKEDARKKARAISRRLRARYGENPMKRKPLPEVEPGQSGVPYFKRLGGLDALDPDRKRKRSVPYNFKLAYAIGWYEAKKATKYGENPMKNKRTSPQWRNMEKSGFRKGQFIGYGGGNVYRISRISGGYIAINQNRATDSFQGKTLSDISFELMDRDVKTNPMKKTRRNPAKFISKGKPIAGITQDDLNAAAKGLRMLSMSPSELDDLAQEFSGKEVFAAQVIVLAARQMAASKRRMGYRENPRRNPTKRKIKAVNRPSQAGGAASAPLRARRKKTNAGPRGFFANPVHTFKVLTRSKPSAPFALVGSFRDKSRAMQYARAIHKASPTSLSVKVTN